MNDVKEICALALEVPAPPPRTSAEALMLARRANRRRDLGLVAASGVAVVVTLAAVAGTALLLPGTHRGGPPVTAPVAVPVRPAAPAVAVPVPPVPSKDAAQANAGRMQHLLLAAVPAGYTGAPEYPEPANMWLVEAARDKYAMLSGVVVSAGGGAGLLQAYLFRDGVAAPSGDLCSAAVTARLAPVIGGAGAPCQVYQIGGVPVRVTTEQDPERGGQVVTAVRLLDGGFLSVVAQQGTVVYQPSSADLPPDAARVPAPGDQKPPLPTQPFPARQVAALAGDPARLG